MQKKQQAKAKPAPEEAAESFQLDPEDDGNVYIQIVSRKIRAIRKKLGKIVQIEEKIEHGQTVVNDNQRELLDKKDSLDALVATLEQIRGQMLKAYAQVSFLE